MTELRIDILGALAVTVGEMKVSAGQPRQCAVLAALALRSPRSVSRTTLVEDVWGDEAPASAEGSLHTYVAALRQLMEPDRLSRSPARTLLTVSGGYRLDLTGCPHDLTSFERLADEARRLRANGAMDEAMTKLWSALTLWRGEALAGIPGPFAERQRNRLAELRLTTLEEWAEMATALGHHQDVTSRLTTELAEHPFRETLARLLMIALWRSGRQVEALSLYRTTRNELIEQLGIEPGPELRRTHEQILSGERHPASESPPSERPARSHQVRPAQTPHAVSGFVGRETEFAELCARLKPCTSKGGPRTVVISAIDGTGGIGKTTLAVQVAHEIGEHFVDGQIFLDLHGFDPARTPVRASEALRYLLASLGVDSNQIPDDEQERANLYRSVLSDRTVLILLDNASSAEQVRPLLPGSSDSCVLVTSRNRLSGLVVTEGAHRVTLDVLSTASATDLLRTSIGEQRVSAEPDATAKLVSLCGSLPLALRVAGERVTASAHHSLAELVEDLSDERGRLDVLETDEYTAVRATFSWSFHALPLEAQRVFRLLSMHPGPGLGLDVAEAITGLPRSAARKMVGTLCSGHLMTEVASRRYGFHDLLRAYGRERLEIDEPAEEHGLAAERMLLWYLHNADAADRLIYPVRRRITLPALPAGMRTLTFEDRNDALAWLESERVNLVAATRFAAAENRSDLAWRLPLALLNFFERRSHFDDWLATHQIGLAAAAACGEWNAEALTCNNLGIMYGEQNEHAESERWFLAAIEVWRTHGDEHGEGQGLINLGITYTERREKWPSAEANLNRAIEIFDRLDRPEGKCMAMENLSDLYRRMRRFDEAADLARASAAEARRLGMARNEAEALQVLGNIREDLRDTDGALAHYEQALEIIRQIKDRLQEALMLVHLGRAARAAGQHQRATASARGALAILDELDFPATGGLRAEAADLLHAPPGTG